MNKYFCWTLVPLLLFSSVASASMVIDFNGFYFTDTMEASTDNKSNRTFYALFLGFSLDKRDRYQVGWSYSNFSTTDEMGTSTTNYSSTQMGPGFLWYLNKKRTWRLGLYYHLKVDGDYEVTGSATEEWRGSSYAADLGYHIQVSERMAFALRLNYSSSAFNESFLGSAKTDVSYSKTLIYPSLGLTAEF